MRRSRGEEEGMRKEKRQRRSLSVAAERIMSAGLRVKNI